MFSPSRKSCPCPVSRCCWCTSASLPLPHSQPQAPTPYHFLVEFTSSLYISQTLLVSPEEISEVQVPSRIFRKTPPPKQLIVWSFAHLHLCHPLPLLCNPHKGSPPPDRKETILNTEHSDCVWVGGRQLAEMGFMHKSWHFFYYYYFLMKVECLTPCLYHQTVICLGGSLFTSCVLFLSNFFFFLLGDSLLLCFSTHVFCEGEIEWGVVMEMNKNKKWKECAKNERKTKKKRKAFLNFLHPHAVLALHFLFSPLPLPSPSPPPPPLSQVWPIRFLRLSLLLRHGAPRSLQIW